MSVAVLTFAAEAMGDCPEEQHDEAIRALKHLLDHPSPVVREGAIYGLAKIAQTNPRARDVLKAHKDADSYVQAALEGIYFRGFP